MIQRRYVQLLVAFSVSFVAILICVGFYLYSHISHTANEIYLPVERDSLEAPRASSTQTEFPAPFAILILDIDKRGQDAGRSDTMIVLIVNPTTSSIKMVSIPRDTYTEISGLGTHDKMNHSYAFGGAGMALTTTENLLNIPIHYVVQINMESFTVIVDAVDGIQLQNEFAFETESHSFSKGRISLTGEQPLAYVRMRHDDPQGDFGRQQRQKQVIEAVLQKLVTVKTMFKLITLLDVSEKHVRTNMTMSDMKEIHANYRSAPHNIDQLHFTEGSGEVIDDIWYYMMDERELETVSEELKIHLGLEE